MADIGRKMVEIAHTTVPSTPAKEVHDRINAGESLVVLDVREPNEWANGVIGSATLLSRGSIEGRLEEEIPDKNTAVVIHRGGTARSALAGQTLKAMGYTNVSYMNPGFSGWKEQGMPFETPSS